MWYNRAGLRGSLEHCAIVKIAKCTTFDQMCLVESNKKLELLKGT